MKLSDGNQLYLFIFASKKATRTETAELFDSFTRYHIPEDLKHQLEDISNALRRMSDDEYASAIAQIKQRFRYPQ